MSNDRKFQLESISGWVWSPFDAQWEEGIAALSSFCSREKHVNVPAKHKESDFFLGSWVRNKKKDYHEGKISIARQQELEAFHGWSWLAEVDQDWEAAFRLLQEYVRMHGHARVPRGYKIEGFNLSTWVLTQRGLYRKKSAGKENALTPDRIVRLEALPGWVWNTIQHRDETAFVALDSFCKRGGHSLVPTNHVENSFPLGKWVSRHRLYFVRGVLEEGLRNRLEKYPGWFWNVHEGYWEQGKQFLLAFIAREGHSRVKNAHVEEGFELGKWIGIWRYQHKKKTLSKEKIDFFESLPNWSWDIKADRWMEKYESLKQYVAREGHANVPAKHIENGLKLGTWVGTQRYSYSVQSYGKRVTQEKIKLLESLPEWTW